MARPRPSSSAPLHVTEITALKRFDARQIVWRIGSSLCGIADLTKLVLKSIDAHAQQHVDDVGDVDRPPVDRCLPRCTGPEIPDDGGMLARSRCRDRIQEALL